jgi:hypothetical protein
MPPATRATIAAATITALDRIMSELPALTGGEPTYGPAQGLPVPASGLIHGPGHALERFWLPQPDLWQPSPWGPGEGTS